jgi:hypothetical protein
MLSNDFGEKRWQTAADKNAMVLLSRKQYEMSIAFFILSNKIKDACTVAIEKMRDINLAVLICRLIEGDEGPQLKSILDQYFIHEGKTCDDPWLVSTALWWQKDYFGSIN